MYAMHASKLMVGPGLHASADHSGKWHHLIEQSGTKVLLTTGLAWRPLDSFGWCSLMDIDEAHLSLDTNDRCRSARVSGGLQQITADIQRV
jgi:hypothetical protein